MPDFPVADAHVDLITWLLDRKPALPLSETASGHLTARGLTAGRARLLVCALYVADCYNGPKQSAERLRLLFSATAVMTAPLVLAFTARDMARTMDTADGPPGYCHLVENADALLETDLGWLTERGTRLVGLTHAGSNRLADGNAVVNPRGLTAEGRALAADLGAAGLALDVAHLAEPGFWQIMDDYEGPVLCSHTGLRAFCDTPRNLSEAQADALIARGGVIGLAFAPELLSPDRRASLDTVAAHIDHLASRHGPDQIVLGSDFGGFHDPCAGLEDCSCYQAVGQALLSKGYAPSAISNIMGGNLLRFLTALYPS